ncbi:DNA/RNA helicase domain-containing protein, partial [Lactobacillus delbrueckii subsp. bulgaricus]|nr:DNA replication initiation protein [Lactobacillus delbrueckii subsp. bulgaricus]
VDPSKFTDIEAFKKRKDLFNDQELNEAKKRLFMNMINVLLKRGVYGTYIYAHDPLLRQTLYQNYQKLISKHNR